MKKFKNTTEGRKQLLNYVLQKELERYRKIIFPYKRRPLLWNPIKIQQRWLTKIKALGLYNWNENHKTHVITIDRGVINNVMFYKYVPKYHYCINKKNYDKELVQTVKHELMHSFIRERFRGCCYKIKDVNNDASPIFISYLTYFGIRSNHDAMWKFEYSKLYKKVLEYKNNPNLKYEDFEDYMFYVANKYNSIASKYQTVVDQEKKIYITNEFEFSPRKSGLYGIQCADIYSTRGRYLKNKNTDNKLEDKFFKYKLEANSFEIGANVDPKNFKKILDRKLANENFEEHKVCKKYLTDTITEVVINSNWNSKKKQCI